MVDTAADRRPTCHWRGWVRDQGGENKLVLVESNEDNENFSFFDCDLVNNSWVSHLANGLLRIKLSGTD